MKTRLMIAAALTCCLMDIGAFAQQAAKPKFYAYCLEMGLRAG